VLQEGVGVRPLVSCSSPIASVGLVDPGSPTWIPGGCVELVGVVVWVPSSQRYGPDGVEV
jgi:hypothetical protein